MNSDDCIFQEFEDATCGQSEEWIPQVPEQSKPKVGGLLFETLEEGEEFYNRYAKESGFSVRKGSTTYDSKGENKFLTSKLFTCAKAGFREPKEETSLASSQRKRRITRVGCEACIRIKLKSDLKWEISKFVEGHNHSLASPHKVHLLRSHRRVSPFKKSLLNTLKSANVQTARAIYFFGLQSGGYGNIGCTERDIRNYERDERQAKKDYDAQDFLDILKQEKEYNPSFYFDFKVDKDNKLTHCFWADGYARKSYAHFGSVVVFDTTYDTNEYCLIFAPFTGLNHHRQSILFGVGLLKDEKAESFCWLFNQWLHAMSGQQPKDFITDQDPAMALAITKKFPHAVHRFCLWHILKKVSEKVKINSSWEEFYTPFKSCIWDSETSEEFEMRWGEIISAHGLEGNEWLQSLYNIRQNWIPVYSNDIFMGGMKTTQRSESINAAFDKHVGKKNSLCAFYMHFKMAIERMKHKELELDHLSLYSEPQLRSKMLMENQMAKIYTHEIFDIFQMELLESMYYLANLKSSENSLHTFVVKKSGGRRTREVKYDVSEQKAICSCKKFQSEGIPCRHMIMVFRCNYIEYLPVYYILDRWTMNAKTSRVFDNDGIELRVDNNDTLPSLDSGLTRIAHRCLHRASSSIKLKAYLENVLIAAEDEMKKMALNEADVIREDTTQRTETIGPFIRPPDRAKTKGSGIRIKEGKEKAMEQATKSQRLCHGCGKRGVDHDKRNCPVLKEGIPLVPSQSTVVETQVSIESWSPIASALNDGCADLNWFDA